MTSIVNICVAIMLMSVTGLVAMGSFCFVCGMAMVLFGRDVE